MKKLLFVLAIGAFAACGSGASSSTAVDTTAKKDSTPVVTVDTTAKKDTTAPAAPAADTTKKAK